MKRPTRNAAVQLVILMLAGGCASGAHQPSGPMTMSLQGGGVPTCEEQHRRDFYAFTVAAFAIGPGHIDVSAYEQKVYALYRELAVFRGADPEAMVDHIKAIPRQMIDIVKKDPAVLESCTNFSTALSGPS
jgi:hypothetical protein